MLDSKPTLFGRFFINCDNFNQSLNCWDVSSVIKMEQMFVGCTSLTTLPHWYRA
ncbi:BspA family leucine-rich repeat surface protein [Helicobacter salomonis]|uniref:BspA family leucine-rich repeat surface protein n=1 Tax=Helicobacter salomonis TaxID=56878 RepID=UPI000CF03C37|nr:BspA family leucine-rich repeat surface protein [Helicobacter salomonis]